jgi:hypothetical protein
MPKDDFATLRDHVWVGRFRLLPSARSYHPDRVAMHDDTWTPSPNADGTVRLSNPSTGHFVDLRGEDVLAVHEDTLGPLDGLRHFQVRLRQQLWLCGPRAGWMSRERAVGAP